DVLDPLILVGAVVAAIVIGVLLGVVSGSGGGGVMRKLIAGVWIAIVGFNVLGSVVSGLSGIRLDIGLVAAVSIVVGEIVFAILMRAPTIQGRKLMDEIAGFRMYLDTAEKSRLNFVDKGEPQMPVTR